MNITVTNDQTNEILTAREISPTRLPHYEQPGQTVHRGLFPANRYDFNGSDFTLKGDAAELTSADLTDAELVRLVLNQLKQAGVEIPLHFEMIANKDHAKHLIDQAADRVRQKYVSAGFLIVEEYQEALKQAKAFVTDSTVSQPMITTLSDVRNTTELDAASYIINTAAQWKQVLAQTYDLRLRGKKAVDQASVNFKLIALGYIQQLNNLG